MSLVLVVIGASAVAYIVGRRWAVAIAPVAGFAVGALIANMGRSLQDTPLPFGMALATISSAGGLVVRRRAMWRARPRLRKAERTRIGVEIGPRRGATLAHPFRRVRVIR